MKRCIEVPRANNNPNTDPQAVDWTLREPNLLDPDSGMPCVPIDDTDEDPAHRQDPAPSEDNSDAKPVKDGVVQCPDGSYVQDVPFACEKRLPVITTGSESAQPSATYVFEVEHQPEVFEDPTVPVSVSNGTTIAPATETGGSSTAIPSTPAPTSVTTAVPSTPAPTSVTTAVTPTPTTPDFTMPTDGDISYGGWLAGAEGDFVMCSDLPPTAPTVNAVGSYLCKP